MLQFGLFCGILLFVNILANSFYTQLDLTEERRFTMTHPTRDLLRDLDDRIYVEVLLEGDFPAGFKRLQTAAREMLNDFRSENGFIEYKFENPGEGKTEEVNARRKALAEQGIIPINLRVSEESGSSPADHLSGGSFSFRQPHRTGQPAGKQLAIPPAGRGDQ